RRVRFTPRDDRSEFGLERQHRGDMLIQPRRITRDTQESSPGWLWGGTSSGSRFGGVAMRDAIRPDEPRPATTDEPVPAAPSQYRDEPDLRLPESSWDRAPIWIVLVYSLAFFVPITFSTEYGAGFVLFLWSLLCTVAYPVQFWKEPAAGYLVVCWL